MATFSGRVVNSQIVLVVWVTISGDTQVLGNPKAYKALLDTGAQVTMVSGKVVEEVGLIASGFFPISGVTGDTITANKYKVRIDIPIIRETKNFAGDARKEPVASGKDIDVALFPASFKPEAFDVLLGMDFLYGFHLTMFADTFILSN